MLTNNPIKALLLVGGKSTRMGEDKSLINYHGKPQWEFLIETLTALKIETFISCNSSQNFEATKNKIIDRIDNQGPFKALISAFELFKNTAWLVIACDMPNVTKAEISNLIELRNTNKIATAYLNKITNMPDPFFTIWEPTAYAKILESKQHSPSRFLNENDIELCDQGNQRLLLNVNSKTDLANSKNII